MKAFASAAPSKRRIILSQIERTFTALTGVDARRRGGTFYGDRMVIFEECAGTLGLARGGRAFISHLDRLRPVLDLCAAHATEVSSRLQAEMAQIFPTLSGGATSLPLPAFLHRMQDGLRLPSDGQFSDTAASRYLEKLVRDALGDGEEVSLTLRQGDVPVPADFEKASLVLSLDVMIRAKSVKDVQRGAFQLVLGEIHDTLLLWNWPLQFHPNSDAVHREAEGLLARLPSRPFLANVLHSRDTKLAAMELPGITVEVRALGRNPDRLPISELDVVVEGGRLLLRSRLDGRILRLHNGELRSPAHATFAIPQIHRIPVRCGRYTPRIEINGVVYQRRTWEVTGDDINPRSLMGDRATALLEARSLLQRLALPRFVFVRSQQERKPFLVDMLNPHLLRMLGSALEQGEEVSVTEMLPDRSELWLRDRSGSYCLEFRLSGAYV